MPCIIKCVLFFPNIRSLQNMGSIGTKRIICNVVLWHLDTIWKCLSRWAGNDHTEYNCKICAIIFVGRSVQPSHNRLLLLRTKAALNLDWGSNTLDITTAGIVGVSYSCMVLCIALCWCGHCLLTVGGNWLPHTVTPLDVTTVAWCCRQTQNVLHHAQFTPAALQTSQWQWTARVFNTWYCTGRYSRLVTADKCL